MSYYPVYIPALNRYEHFRNCGQDGSGLHCAVNSAASQQKISEATTFDFSAEPPRVSRKGLFWQGWETTRFAKFMPWVRVLRAFAAITSG